MSKKLVLLVGLAVGYVIGTSRGRSEYVRIRTQAQRVWKSDRVQDVVDKVEDVVRDKIPVVGPVVADAVDRVKPTATGTSS